MECRLARRIFATGGRRRKAETKTNSGARHLKRKQSKIMYNSINNKKSQPAERSWKTKVGATVSALAAIAALTVLTASAEKPASKTVRADIDKSAVIAGPVYDKDGNLANGDPPLPGDTPLWGNNYGSCSQFRPITWH